MPIVAMNRMIGAWLTSGRSTSALDHEGERDHDRDRDDEGEPGVDADVVDQAGEAQSAANSTMAPWAKLNTPEALKISTKPSATSEYITPAISPPITHLDEEQRQLRDHHERIDEDRVEHAHGAASRVASQRSKSAFSACDLGNPGPDLAWPTVRAPAERRLHRGSGAPTRTW